MDGHYNKIINRINNMSEKNEFLKAKIKEFQRLQLKSLKLGLNLNLLIYLQICLQSIQIIDMVKFKK